MCNLDILTLCDASDQEYRTQEKTPLECMYVVLDSNLGSCWRLKSTKRRFSPPSFLASLQIGEAVYVDSNWLDIRGDRRVHGNKKLHVQRNHGNAVGSQDQYAARIRTILHSHCTCTGKCCMFCGLQFVLLAEIRVGLWAMTHCELVQAKFWEQSPFGPVFCFFAACLPAYFQVSFDVRQQHHDCGSDFAQIGGYIYLCMWCNVM